MYAHAFLNELFKVFVILFHVKVCVGTMLSFQKSDCITNKRVVASFDYF